MSKSQQKISGVNPMELLLQKQQVPNIKKGQEINAKIVSITKKGTLFNIGSKANAVLGEKEIKEIFLYQSHLKPGDTVKVRIISEESRDGNPVVSMRNFFERGKWDVLLKKKETEDFRNQSL